LTASAEHVTFSANAYEYINAMYHYAFEYIILLPLLALFYENWLMWNWVRQALVRNSFSPAAQQARFASSVKPSTLNVSTQNNSLRAVRDACDDGMTPGSISRYASCSVRLRSYSHERG
jgi:hypothetical protein